MAMLKGLAAFFLLAGVTTGAFAQAPASKAGDKPITIVEPWARATPPGAKVGAAYLEIKAAPGAADKLLSASSPAAGAAELHTHIMEGSVAKMRRVDTLTVPAGGSVAMKPGGHHVMLMDLKGPLKAGENVKLKLKFEKAGEIEVEVAVRPLGNPKAGSGGAGAGAHKH